MSVSFCHLHFSVLIVLQLEVHLAKRDVTKTGNGERATGNGQRGTGNGERVYSGNPPENSKWRRKRCLQTLILSLGCRLQCN